MQAHDIVEILKTPPHHVDPDREAAFWLPEPFGDGMLWVGHFRGTGPWSRHADGDALIHQLAGRVELTVMEEGEPRVITLIPGQLCVVKRGRWFRIHSEDWAAQYGVAPGAAEHAAGDAPPA